MKNIHSNPLNTLHWKIHHLFKHTDHSLEMRMQEKGK